MVVRRELKNTVEQEENLGSSPMNKLYYSLSQFENYILDTCPTMRTLLI